MPDGRSGFRCPRKDQLGSVITSDCESRDGRDGSRSNECWACAVRAIELNRAERAESLSSEGEADEGSNCKAGIQI